MNTKNFFITISMALFFSGCVVYSFYPLYTEKDLFPNNILTGIWLDSDSTVWIFEHASKGDKISENIDSTSYVLNLKDKDGNNSEFKVNIVKLAGHYFLDFYLRGYPGQNMPGLVSFHLVPVHTFAKLTVKQDKLQINWIDGEWLKKQIAGKKIKIAHENNGEVLLLTAKTKNLQKLVSNYASSDDAFKEGLNIELVRRN